MVIMSGSKTSDEDEHRHYSSGSGSGQYEATSPSKRQQLVQQQQNLVHEPITSEVPFSSPASPIPKYNDDDNDDNYQRHPIPSSSFEKSSSTTPLHMELEIKTTTSSSLEENKLFNDANIPPLSNNNENVIPVNFKKKELTCVTDVTDIPPLPSTGTGSFSPLGSVGTINSMDTPTNKNAGIRLPKFYDSEEEGVGSLVLVPSTSKSMSSLTSPRVMMMGGGGGASSGGGGGGGAAPQPPLPKDHRHGLTTTPAHLLPYQQRKKLMVEQEQQQQQPQMSTANATTSVDKRPPVVPSSTGMKQPPSFPSAGAGGGMVIVSELPPPIVSGAELAKKYGGVMEIPPFKGGVQNSREQDASAGGGGDNDNAVVDGTTMKKSKSADSSNKPIPSSNALLSSPVATADDKREKKVDNDTRPMPPVLQEVICQPQSPSTRTSSPSGEGSYHIRVSSCGSISSLGSMAVDSDSIRHAPRRDHPNRDGFQQQQHQQQQQQQQQQQYYQQMQPPHSNHYYGGYPQTQQPPMRGGPPPSGGFVDLSQDIALYLHGEQAAAAQNHHHHHGEYPPQNYWNHNAAYGYGGYQQQHQHYPQPPQAEPIPPPLTQVPNMQMGHRSRLPSISDDDWSEDLEKYKGDGNDGNRGGGGGGGGSRNNSNNQQPYPPPPHRSYNYGGGRDRMSYPHQLPPPSRKRKDNHLQQQQQQRSENRPNEHSSLLGPNGRNYDEYGGWNGNNGGVGGNNNNPNAAYYKTPPRRGNKKNPLETKSTKRKKSKRRRREKEKLRNMYSTDSSPEDDEKHRRSIQRSRRKKRHGGGRKRREDDGMSDTMSETYSESFMSASLTERLKSAEANVNVFQRMMIRTKLLLCNLPLSAAAISFSIVLLGIVWLRRAEEILTSCKEVNFHSSQCNFPEFPGCYFCDTFDRWYQVATKFHTVCSYVGGVSVALYAAKAMFFGRVFIDEMSSPTTASPAGLIFMTMALAFTGKGAAGAVAVFVASFLHLALLLWFIYMSLAYQTMPDPSWFPNTIGIGLCAVKVWFYNPLCGHFLIAMTLMLTFLYYPISLIRVALNEKMSATISWMQMICPAISLYSLAIVMQPSFKEERPDISHFQTMQRSVYLPSMTCLFGLCIVGMISSLHGIAVRWKQIQKEEFTPAHAAYSFPLLMHALAVQAYRSSLGFFSETGEVNPALKSALEIYWIVLVTVGSFVAVVCLLMYLSFLPSWIDVNTSDELEPPAPNETSMFETVTWGESLIQPYVSPTILQSNEAGVLIMTHDYENNWDTLVRTKNVPAVGFEPMMRTRTFNREREALKHLVGGQDVIHEGDEADDDFCFDSVNV